MLIQYNHINIKMFICMIKAIIDMLNSSDGASRESIERRKVESTTYFIYRLFALFYYQIRDLP